MGNTDRIIRGVLGLGAIAAGVYFSSWFGLIGVVFLGTAIFKFCPAYVPFNFSTEKK
jgi:hypothetical protein